VHSTTYTATITTGVTDTSTPPVALSAPVVWSFSTPVPAAPSVTYVNPGNTSSGVPLDSTISATFSKAIDPATVNSGTFELSDGVSPVSGTLSYSNGTLSFDPDDPLTHSTSYTVTVTTGVTDTSVPAVAMAANKIWSFTTAVPTVPEVTGKSPASG